MAVKNLLMKRTILLEKVTRLMQSEISSMSPVVIQDTLDIMNNLKNDLDVMYTDLMLLEGDDTLEARMTEFNNDMNRVDVYRHQLLEANSVIAMASSSQQQTSSVADSALLPMQLSIPPFDGDEKQWDSFSDLFQAAIENSRLSDAQKLQYLKSVSKGKAAQYIASFSIANANSCKAWEALQLRFKNKTSPQLNEEYSQQMEEYISLNHIEEFPKEDFFKQENSSSNISIVFDATSSKQLNKSFNDCKLKRPSIQDDLYTILFSFRLHPVAMTTDITRMYRKNHLHEEDHELNRALWRSSPKETINEFRLKRLTIGTKATPFLAIKVLQQLTEDKKENFFEATSVILKYAHRDDGMTGVESPTEAILFQEQLIDLISSAKSDLQKWASNYSLLPLTSPISKHILDKEIISALGMKWKWRWKFKPPHAPHFGRLCEAGVKSAKYHLKRCAGSSMLNFEELTTILTQIEACLNSRPLCPLSEDTEDLAILTPGHFLTGAALTAPPDADFSNTPINRLNRWQLVQKITRDFWKKWSNEYLTRLQNRPKWLTKQKNLKPGDVVVIKEQLLPPTKWRLGRIKEVYPDVDNNVRVVKLKTSTGEIKRPIHELCQLPINDEDQ